MLAFVTQRLPATPEPVPASAVLALALGIPLGVHTGLHRDSWLSRLVLTPSLVGVSPPTFVIGIGLIYVFAVTPQALPSYGRGEVVRLGWWATGFLTASGWRAIVLPAVTLCPFQLALILRLVRAGMPGVPRTDHIRFARARGLPDRAIHFGHALRNTLVPVVTVAGLQIGSLIALSIVTETVFRWPGMGFLLIQAVQFADIPIMAAYLAMVALFLVVINPIVDLLYDVVDPLPRPDRALAAGRGA